MDREEARGAGRNGRQRDQRGGLVFQVTGGGEWLVRLEKSREDFGSEGDPEVEEERWRDGTRVLIFRVCSDLD